MRIDRARDRGRDRDRDRDRGGLLFLAGATRDARRRRKAPEISSGRRAVESGGARAFARGPPRTSQRLTCFWMTSAARASSASGESLTPRRFDAEPYPSANAMSVNADMMARVAREGEDDATTTTTRRGRSRAEGPAGRSRSRIDASPRANAQNPRARRARGDARCDEAKEGRQRGRWPREQMRTRRRDETLSR